ncbi:transcriptional regulator NrdR [Candidatus Woesearchaeota archaeon]|nr:transcriptional regulator NrdR [Candidatus Woesearchaeota archaeon]
MKCPYCGNTETKVVDKRETAEFEATRRRRECLKCEKRFTTYERVEHIDIVVIKKDGRKEPFDKEKIRKGVLRACEKRPVTLEQIDIIVSRIESDLRKLKTTEIKSEKIGEKVINALKKLDKVAYIRFASVYRSFKDVKDFEKEIKEIKK